jgi:hypothetical protein
MINYDQIERNKNKIVNIGIVILAIFIAFQLYRSANERMNALNNQSNNELEKNRVAGDIATLEKRAEAYKKVFVKKDLALVMDTIYGIAKDTSVKIISVKPSAEEVLDNYSKSSFLITLVAPGYHALGEFISKIENNNDVYLVSDMNVSAAESTLDPGVVKVNLNVNLKINTVSYL